MKPGEAHSAHYCLQSDESWLPSSYTCRSAWPVSDSPEAPLLSGTELGGSDNLTVGHISHVSLACPHEPTGLFVPFFQRSLPLEFPLPGPLFLLIPDRSLFITPHPPPFHSKKGSCKLPLSAQFVSVLHKGKCYMCWHLRGECALSF
ncbi:unnamed protein product [Rangifer tarandus platyrhynchus]|uniref:Uncharacterized protein n=1 Tax=Rangifer tarandus platyrhynchus TaxID=3082113 RepID=A0AC59YAA8_RANTA